MIQLAPIVLSTVAMMAGGPATVSCQPAPLPAPAGSMPPSGLAWPTSRRILLVDYICAQLNWMAARRRLPRPTKTGPGEWTDNRVDFAVSLGVVVHEAGHLRHPEWSEACVQRFAVRHVKFAAARLGLRKADRREVVEDVRDQWLRPDYRPCACSFAPPPINPDRR